MTSDHVRAAERWWDELPDDRKVQVHRWLNPELYAGVPEPIPGQQAIPLRGKAVRPLRRDGHDRG